MVQRPNMCHRRKLIKIGQIIAVISQFFDYKECDRPTVLDFRKFKLVVASRIGTLTVPNFMKIDQTL